MIGEYIVRLITLFQNVLCRIIQEENKLMAQFLKMETNLEVTC